MFGFTLKSVRRKVRRRLRSRRRRQRGSGANPYLKVKYADVEVAGQRLTEDLTNAIPTVELSPNLNPSDYYTLIMDDADAPSRFPFMHWFVVNIHGTDFSSGTPVYDYIGPSPPSGKHRYVIQLYKQPLGIAKPPTVLGGSAPGIRVPADRGLYDKRQFIAAEQLQPVGAPLYFFVGNT